MSKKGDREIHRRFNEDINVEPVHVIADGLNRPLLLAKILECKFRQPKSETVLVVFALDITTLFFKLLLEALPSFPVKNIPHKLHAPEEEVTELLFHFDEIPDLQAVLDAKHLLFTSANFLQEEIKTDNPLKGVDQIIFYEQIDPKLITDILQRIETNKDNECPTVMSFVQPIISTDKFVHDIILEPKESTCTTNACTSKRSVSREYEDEVKRAIKSSFDICRCAHDSYTAYVHYIIKLSETLPSFVKMYGRMDILTMAGAFGLSVPPRVEELSTLN